MNENMKELNNNPFGLVSGGDVGETIAVSIGAGVGGAIGAEFGMPGIGAGIGAAVGSAVYGGAQNGYSTAPGVKQGLGSFNPNYSGRPMLCNPLLKS